MKTSVEYAAARLDVDPLYTPSEVAAIFRVNPKTVTRWAQDGKLPCIRTIGGHRRFRRADIRRLARVQGILEPERQEP